MVSKRLVVHLEQHVVDGLGVRLAKTIELDVDTLRYSRYIQTLYQFRMKGGFWSSVSFGFWLLTISYRQTCGVTSPAVTAQTAEKAGCMDKQACNYDIEATRSDGSCVHADRCYSTNGCMNITACNYNPGASKDDGTCTPAPESGFDCQGNSLAVDATGTINFIKSPVPVLLTKGKTHARVDLPENFEVGFEITPQKHPLDDVSNIIHFTATGEVMASLKYFVCILLIVRKCVVIVVRFLPCLCASNVDNVEQSVDISVIMLLLLCCCLEQNCCSVGSRAPAVWYSYLLNHFFKLLSSTHEVRSNLLASVEHPEIVAFNPLLYLRSRSLRSKI